MNDEFSKKLNAKMNSMNKSNQRLRRKNSRFSIDKEVLEFCLMEVQKTECNLSTLEIYIVSLSLENKFSRG